MRAVENKNNNFASIMDGPLNLLADKLCMIAYPTGDADNTIVNALVLHVRGHRVESFVEVETMSLNSIHCTMSFPSGHSLLMSCDVC